MKIKSKSPTRKIKQEKEISPSSENFTARLKEKQANGVYSNPFGNKYNDLYKFVKESPRPKSKQSKRSS